MCGIAGYTGRFIEGVLEKMSDALTHRGPDACGFFNTPEVHLMHRRLKVIDLESGAQPMTTVDGTLTVIFNGEIYNHKELRRELEQKGHTFQTNHSDTEVLLHAYRQWGEGFTSRLNGMWALCIYDQNENRLLLSRDRFGQKPLYYTQIGNELIFSSELSGIEQHPQARTDISEISLQKFFAYGFIPHPHTIYRQVHKLPGGYNLLYSLDNSELQLKRYWKYTIEPDYSLLHKPKEDLYSELRHLLAQATKRRLESDVSLGILLSGGIDSSAIATFAATDSPNISTFSIGFDQRSYDESAFSTRVANQLQSNHHLDVLTLEQTKDYLPEILSRLDEPQGDDSLLPTYLVCRTAREKVTVALGGDGGDELFSGYEPFRFWRWGRRYNLYLPGCLQRFIESHTDKLPRSDRYMSRNLKLKRFFHASGLKMPVWIPSLLAPLHLEDIAELFNQRISLDELYSEAIADWNDCQSSWPGDKISQYYVDYYLQDGILAKTDRASMLNSLELRSPFLDIELVDFARKLPHQLKINCGTTKYILKKALKPLLPHDILYRSKQGFSPPVSGWFTNGSLSLQGRNIAGIRKEKIEDLLQKHRNGSTDNRLFLWNQLALEYFQQRINNE